MKDLQIAFGWFFIWLMTIILERKWQSLSACLTSKGWHYIGWGIWELPKNDSSQTLTRGRNVV